MYNINKVRTNPTIDYAAEELKKYLRMMMPRCGEIPVAYKPYAENGFRLGLMADFGLDMSDAEDTTLDDIVYIDADANGGIIAGSNPCALLIAVYRYLRACGCRWLFPGVDGEWVPIISELPKVNYRKLADYRYRGQCNEGAEYQPNMMEAIEFAPKIGMNTFMIEFDIPFQYYNVYYNHSENPMRPKESVDYDTILQWKRQCEVEVEKRGMHFHDMGHGWTSESFGIESFGRWDAFGIEVPENVRQYLAEVNGKRELFRGVPVCTNACFSNPEARKLIANHVADYAEVQNNVGFLHIWLADDTKNFCECEKCREKIVSDWYVILLNEIDEELTRRGLDTHLVFIDYTDTIWAPKTERLNNNKRFTMLYAGGICSESYLMDADSSNLTEYVVNKSIYPKTKAERLGYLNEWKKVWTGDCFSYEYHFFFGQYYDMGSMTFAKLVYDDIVGLKKHGLRGSVEDCSQRSFFPTGFAFYVYGETLFDSTRSFEELKEDYFSHAFGDKWQDVVSYLEKISACFDYDYIMNYRRASDEAHKKNAELAKPVFAIVDEFAPVIAENMKASKRASAVSWQVLYNHCDFVKYFTDIMIKKANGDLRGAILAEKEFKEDFGKREIYMERHYDQYLFWQAHKQGQLFFQGKDYTEIPV